MYGYHRDLHVRTHSFPTLRSSDLKTVGSFLVVELMRQGASPGEACKVAVERIVMKYPNYREIQVGYLAMNKQGEYGSYSIHKGFSYAVHDGSGNRLQQSAHYINE